MLNNMFLQNVQVILQAFVERFVPVYHDGSEWTNIAVVDGKVRFTYGNEYYIYAWFDGVEFKIVSEFGDNVLKMADAFEWTEEQVCFMQYGFKGNGKIEMPVLERTRYASADLLVRVAVEFFAGAISYAEAKQALIAKQAIKGHEMPEYIIGLLQNALEGQARYYSLKGNLRPENLPVLEKEDDELGVAYFCPHCFTFQCLGKGPCTECGKQIDWSKKQKYSGPVNWP